MSPEWIDKALDLLKSPIPSTTLLGLALLYLILHPDKLEKLSALIWRLVLFLGRFSSHLKGSVGKRWVAADIQAIVNDIGEEINRQADGAIPNALRIEWIADTNEEAFLRKGEVIVRLRQHENQDRNIVMATLCYLGKGLLPRARSYIDASLLQGTEYTVAKGVLAKARGTGASDYFFQHVLKPALAEQSQLYADCSMLDAIDSAGYFTRVFLAEVHEFGERTHPALPSPSLAGEIRSFADFLHEISAKGKGVDVPLQFSGARIRIGIVLVAKPITIAQAGLEAYHQRMTKLMREGFDVIYLCGWGEPNMKSIRALVKDIRKQGQLRVVRQYEYPVPRYRGEFNRAIVVCLQSSAHFVREEKRKTEPVREALLRHIPEIEEGIIEIVGLVREPGIGSKIAVQWADEPTYAAHGASEACLGTVREVIKDIRNELDDEWVAIVDWSPDPTEFACNALYPLSRSEVFDAKLDEENLEITVFVCQSEAVKKALGKNGTNVRLAEELTGWRIRIETAPEHMVSTQIVRRVVMNQVPEVAAGEIEIVNIARRPGFRTKIGVRLADSAMGSVTTAVQACIGHKSERVRAIARELGEQVSIVGWEDEPTSLVVSSLYPLRSHEVFETVINEETRQVNVVVKTESAATAAIGRRGENRELAEKLTGWRIEVEVRAEPTNEPQLG